MSPSLRLHPPYLLLIAGAVLAVFATVAYDTAAGTPLYLAVMALAGAAACVAAGTALPATRRTAQFGAASVVLYGVGDLVWWVVVWSGGQPDSPVADLLYLASYAALGVVLVLVLMPLQSGRWAVDADVIIDILTVVAVSLLVLWELVIRDSVGPTNRSTLVYPLLDAVLLGLTVRILTNAQSRRRAGSLIAGALVCLLLGDYGYLERGTGAVATRLTDPLWMTAMLLLGWAVVRLSSLPPAVAAARVVPSTASRLTLAIGPLAVPPGLVVVEEAIGRDPESWSLVVGIVVLIALAFVRTERLLAQERRTRQALALARDAALEASRAKTAFLAGISHEIRTPMNGVLGLSRLLLDTTLDENQRRYTQGIERAGESLMTLLNDVLDFAKFETGPVETESLDFDVVELVEDVAAMVTEQAHHAGLELVAHVAPDLPRWLNGDPTRIRQVLLNFAANAVKFTEHGQVVIRAGLEEDRSEGPLVRFSVSDTGIGVAARDQERLFEPFVQADASTTRRYGGSGLGLAIVRTVADALGGEVGVDSTPGQGSSFWCLLPLAPARRSRLVLTRPSRAVAGTRVLLVDDNATVREVLADQLRQWGLEVTAVPGGPDALCTLSSAAAGGTTYDLVIVDHDLSGSAGPAGAGGLLAGVRGAGDLNEPHGLGAPGEHDGLELAERIIRDPALGNVTTVLLTSGLEPTLERLEDAGVKVHLSKPVQVARLQGAVQRALGTNTALELPVHARPWRDLPPDRGVVLVVEDSEVNRLVAVGTLRQLGYLAEVAVNGQEAIEAVTSRRYDAVLMDCRMPVLDGYDATREIRRIEAGGPRTPIIAVTANASTEDRARCLEDGMDDYLAKPLSRQLLADTLVRWVPVTPTSPQRV